jgi:hypothetical protein
VGLSDNFFKGNHPMTILAKLSLTWFSGFREEDLNVIFFSSETTEPLMLYYKSK